MQYGSVVEVCQVGHILAFFVLGGVHLSYLFLLEILLLYAKKRALKPSLDTYVNKFHVESMPQVVQDGSFVQIGQIGHIFDFFVFRRVHLVNLILFELFLLFSQNSLMCDRFRGV